MINKVLFMIISLIIVGCSAGDIAMSQSHPANQYFKVLEYPKVGMNQISTSKIRRNPGIINDLAKLDLVIINKSDDLFVDKDSSYEYARQIKAINPRVKVLQYLSISDIWDYQDTFKSWIKAHPEVLLKDNNGDYLHPYESSYGKKRYMLDSTNPLWQDYFAARMKKVVDQGMNGVFVDNCWRSNWQNLNISPQKFLEIQQGWEITMKKARNLIGQDKIIMGNSPPFQLYQTRDLTMFEGRLKPDPFSLKEYFNWTSQGNSYGQLNFDAVKFNTYSGSNFHYVTDFFLPAVLLTDNIWGFSYESPQWFQLISKLGKIGYPASSAKRMPDGILTRDFSKAKVFLNDTGSEKTVKLPENTYMTIDNEPVNQLTLKPMQGVVLKRKNL